MTKASKKYYETHCKGNPEWLAYNSNRAMIYKNRLRKELLDMLGGKCIRCGFTDVRALQIDHINGGGSSRKRVSSAQTWKAMIEEIKAGSQEYQILCANCNWIKREELGEVKGGRKGVVMEVV